MTNPGDDPEKADRDGHGTHVSGIIAGHGFDAKDVEYFGLAPQARLLVYKVLNDRGEGEDAWIIKAIDDIFRRNQNATNIQVHGVNLSLGGPFDATVYGCGFSPICKELRDLWQQGVLVCVAAGNEGQIEVSTADGSFDLNTLLSVGDPANLEDCIAVGSVNTDKPNLYGISWFSSRGPTADGRMKPDVVAPGERIVSCDSDFRSEKDVRQIENKGQKGGGGENREVSCGLRHEHGVPACFRVAGFVPFRAPGIHRASGGREKDLAAKLQRSASRSVPPRCRHSQLDEDVAGHVAPAACTFWRHACLAAAESQRLERARPASGTRPLVL